MVSNTLRLVTLGRLDLLGPTGAPADPSLSARRRKIALLVLLAAQRRPVSRDTLLEMFWGEQDETRARHSLSDALSHLRRVLGRGAISANQATASLDPSANLSVDTAEFASAVKEGEDARALELYGGPFLDGVHVDGSASFEQWVSTERHRLSALFGRACARRAGALAEAANWDECADVALRWLESEPASSAAAKFRIEAIAALGTREAAVRAVQEFERIAQRLQSELGLRPDAAVAEVARQLAARIRADELPAGHTGEFSVAAVAPTREVREIQEARSVPTALPPSHVQTATATKAVPARDTHPASDDSASSVATNVTGHDHAAAASEELPADIRTTLRADAHRERGETVHWARWGVIAAVLIVAIAAGVWFKTRQSPAKVATAERTVVALTDFEFLNGDSAQTWMAQGFSTMLASRLSRSNALELISPDRIREIARRAQYPTDALYGIERSRDIGERAGANWVVAGALSKADTLLRLELTVRDVKSGKVLRVSNVTAKDVLSLTDAAAAQLLDVVDPAGSGARLTDLETSSQEAYQHFVAYVRYQAGISNSLAKSELDKALALDSGFISAIIERRKMAKDAGDRTIELRLDTLFAKHQSRASFWDRTTLEAERLFALGKVGPTLALYRELVSRYPRDPRAYTRLWNTLQLNGEWAEAEQVALRQLAIDSLAVTAGNGVCAPCGAYSDVAHTRLSQGDAAGAERAVRRLIELQPDLGGAWSALATTLFAGEKYDEGLEAYRRARALNPEELDYWTNAQSRHLILANRLADADTMIATLERSPKLSAQRDGMDIRSLWYREQGKWKEALALIDQFERAGGDARQARLMRGNTLAHMGDYDGARRAFESVHELFEKDQPGDYARWFSWTHTLMGDAFAPTGDTVLLKVLADSALIVGADSYYARDKMVPHYLRALVAMKGGRAAEAEQEFKAALYSMNGFNRVNTQYARLLISQKRYDEAEKLLHQGLMGPLDAMPRYQPRSELRRLIDSVRALRR